MIDARCSLAPNEKSRFLGQMSVKAMTLPLKLDPPTVRLIDTFPHATNTP